MYANQLTPSPDSDILAAAGIYFPSATGASALAGFPHQVIVQSGNETWAVRRWAAAQTITAVEWTADAMEAAGVSGLLKIPEHARVPGRGAQRALLHAGRVYDAIRWPDGRPLNRYGTFSLIVNDTINLPLPDSMASPDVLVEAIQALARFHLASQSLANRADAPVYTLEAMLTATENIFAQLRKTVGSQAGGNQEIRRWLRSGNRILPAATDRIAEATALAQARTAAVHTDLWPSRLMVDEIEGRTSLTGIVGWTQTAAGSPILDLARLAARCARWSAATAETVVGAYSEIAPITPEQRRMLPVIAALDLTTITGTMLQAAYEDDRIANDPVQSFIRSGVQTSVRSLETLANVLAPEERKSAARVYRARPKTDRPRRKP